MPPDADTVAIPLAWPLHLAAVGVTNTMRSGGEVSVTDAVPVQPWLSVTVTV